MKSYVTLFHERLFPSKPTINSTYLKTQEAPLYNFADILNFKTFIFFPELFLSTSCVYVILVSILVTLEVPRLVIQKALSNCIAAILFMSCFLLNNDIFLLNNVISYASPHSLLLAYNTTIAVNLSNISKIVICFSSGLYFLIISNVLKKYSLTCFEYLVLILFAIIGHILLCSADDLLTAYVAIELFSLSSYVIAASKKQSTHSIKGGLKYFITGSLSSAFFLLGSSFYMVE